MGRNPLPTAHRRIPAKGPSESEASNRPSSARARIFVFPGTNRLFPTPRTDGSSSGSGTRNGPTPRSRPLNRFFFACRILSAVVPGSGCNSRVAQHQRRTPIMARSKRLLSPLVPGGLGRSRGRPALTCILRADPCVPLLEFLETHDQITNKEARDICFIGSENKMKRVFQRMMTSDLIELVPGTTRYTAAYRLVRKEPP
jgi:hypothetical protein